MANQFDYFQQKNLEFLLFYTDQDILVNCDEKRRALNIGKDVYTSHHKYVNKTNKPRFAVNFNMIHPDNIGQTMSKMHSRKFEKLFHPKNFRKPRPYNKFEIILLGIK